MSWVLDLRLIPLFSFYLALVFCLSTGLRLSQYFAILSLVRKFPGRWPHLLTLVRQYTHLFLGWKTIFPLVVVLVLLLVNVLAGRLVWPLAQDFTLRELLAIWPLAPVVAVSGAAMLAYDAYGTWNVGKIDGQELEGYFDQAEYWLRSWKAPVVRWITLGWVNPRQMVDREVRTALEGVSDMLNSTLWWVSIQTGLRIGYGLSLWSSYLLQGWLN